QAVTAPDVCHHTHSNMTSLLHFLLLLASLTITLSAPTPQGLTAPTIILAGTPVRAQDCCGATIVFGTFNGPDCIDCTLAEVGLPCPAGTQRGDILGYTPGTADAFRCFAVSAVPVPFGPPPPLPRGTILTGPGSAIIGPPNPTTFPGALITGPTSTIISPGTSENLPGFPGTTIIGSGTTPGVSITTPGLVVHTSPGPTFGTTHIAAPGVAVSVPGVSESVTVG
ncbi:hypothetical protein HDV00_001462, partial [Rhizophlyctis rosea]